LELVEAQQAALVRDVVGHGRDGVALGAQVDVHFSPVLQQQPLLVRVYSLVNLQHEFVEMHPALGRQRAVVVEDIHRHGFPHTDLPVDVHTFEPRRRRRWWRRWFGWLGRRLGSDRRRFGHGRCRRPDDGQRRT